MLASIGVNILEALEALAVEEASPECDILINGMRPIHDEVFKVALKNIGLDPSEYMDEPIEDRDFIMEYYEHRAKETNAKLLS